MLNAVEHATQLKPSLTVSISSPFQPSISFAPGQSPPPPGCLRQIHLCIHAFVDASKWSLTCSFNFAGL